MSALVLTDADVRKLLDMESCIEAMVGVLAALQRQELSMPLRFVFRPGGTSSLMGFMPAHRASAPSLFSLKEIVISPGNSARGLDPHQGAVLLHDGETGELTALLNASAITEIRTAAVSAVATRLLARPAARTVAILGAGVQARSHVEAMRVVLEDPEIRVWSRGGADRARALAQATGATLADSVEEACAGADVVCTCTSAREPVLSLGVLAAGAHVNAVGSSIPTTRELTSQLVAAASLFVDRRESTLNEAGDYLFAVQEQGIGPEHIRAELGEVLEHAHPGRTDDGELTVFKSLGIAVEDLAAAELCLARARERGLGTEIEF
jgi:ornithine cyclodeaminase/alanine dehydrogenase-like protein (mu-crystallin family)